MFQDSKTIKIVILDDNIEGDIKDFKLRLEQELPAAKDNVKHFKYAYEEFINDPTIHNDTDIVLLDVEGMPPTEDVIFDIHAKWLRLPIVILSKYEQLSPALDYFRAGAKGYLIKKELPPYIGDETRNVKKAWKDAVYLIESLVKEYRPIKYLLYDDRITGTLKKERGPNTPVSKFSDQLAFLKIIKDMRGSSVGQLFPVEILQPVTDDLYKIPYYRAKSLREVLFELRGEEEIIETAKAVISKVLIELKTELFGKSGRPVTENKTKWFKTSYIDKLEYRTGETIGLLGQCNAADSNALSLLLQAERLVVGGECLLSPAKLLSIIQADETLMNQLVPEKTGYIHGDLHFSNILVDTTILERPFIKLIDPAGFLTSADFAYDVGKLLLSSGGKHDMIDEEYLGSTYNVDLVRSVGSVNKDDLTTISVDKPARKYERERTLNKGRSGDIVKSYSQEITDVHFRAYERIAQLLQDEWLVELMNDDPGLGIRSRLNAALHSCTVGKFHLEREPKGKGPIKVIAFYVTGVELMNKLARDLGVDIEARWKEMDSGK